ncbi:MAG TPA: peptidylprolyl isomerase [Planctomycetaceae bacterium]|nr:peptidylprolyl isomerase [Planctomycetaceae bacterium]
MALRFRHGLTGLLVLAAIGCAGSHDAGNPPIRTAGVDGDAPPPAGDPFKVKFVTSKGDVVIEVHPKWAPHGAARFRELVESGFYEGCRFFRVVKGFMAQTGLHGDPEVNAKWRDRRIPDDPVVESNRRGYVAFATGGPDTRTTQFFISYRDNPNLDRSGFAPFGRVVEGMDVVDKLHSAYGDAPPRGSGPDQARILAEGNEYLEREFPRLDYIEAVSIIEDGETPPPDEGAAPADPAGEQPEAASAPAGADSAADNAAREEGAQDRPFRVKLVTSQGDVLIEVHPEWAPRGAARFRELVQAKFYDGCRFFRVLDGFMAQTGINGDPETNAKWRERRIEDDPVVRSNTRGHVTFATSGPDSRTTQFFINFGDNSQLDDMGFSPFGKVVEGMNVVDKLYSGYGEGAPRGRGPSQGRINEEGNAYLERSFPRLDSIKQAVLVEESRPKAPEPGSRPTE